MEGDRLRKIRGLVTKKIQLKYKSLVGPTIPDSWKRKFNRGLKHGKKACGSNNGISSGVEKGFTLQSKGFKPEGDEIKQKDTVID